MCYYVNTRYIWNRPHLFPLWFNDVKCTKFLFFYVFCCNLKEKDHIRRNIISKKKKKETYIREISVIIILICWNVGSVWPVQQKIKLPSPYEIIDHLFNVFFCWNTTRKTKHEKWFLGARVWAPKLVYWSPKRPKYVNEKLFSLWLW